jgi:hypothetical protein
VSKAEDSLGSRWVQPKGSSSQQHGDLVGGRFQSVQGRVTSCAERGAARLAAEGLDGLCTAMLAIPDEGVELSIGVPEVGVLLIRTGEAFGGDARGGSSLAFDLSPGAHRSGR